jgi:deoxyribonuclease V
MPNLSHSWSVTPAEAIAIQKELRQQIRLAPLRKQPELIAGADVSMSLYATTGFAGFVTMSYPNLIPQGESVVEGNINFPYIPGLLSFREIPMLQAAWDGLKTKPDLIIVDGVGIAHPRRLGIASHLGLILGVPTIGCAKSVLTGIYEEPGSEPGLVSYLYDRSDREEKIGAALRTKRGVKPVFISPGHLITLEESIEIVRKCVVRHRLPEPTRRAHLAVNDYRIRALAIRQDRPGHTTSTLQ